ncbi:hypothetical protein FQN54_008743 [Arachnomyces sp. PD_36]|nr:hypothetical protein FQN54_008743 [Arachnomyces sp. PD_36]
MSTPAWNSRKPYSSQYGPQQPQRTAPPHHCITCSRDFVCKTALQDHLRTAKAHRRNTTNAPPNPDIVLANTSPRRPEVKANPHYGLHNRPTSAAHCSMCNRDFANGPALEMHMKYSKIHRNGNNASSKTMTKTFQPTIAHKENIPSRPLISSPPTATFGALDIASPLISLSPPITAARLSQSNGDFDYHTDDYDSDGPWSRIPEHKWVEVLSTLSQQCHSVEVLEKNGYRVSEYTQYEMNQWRKCKNCGRQKRKIESSGEYACIFHPQKPGPGQGKKKRSEITYLCCGEGGRGCKANAKHEYAPLDTPLKYKLSSYAHAPTYERVAVRKSPAIALDCEMAGVLGGQGEILSEVVRLCAVDYITGNILIDTLVVPFERIVQWRTKYSGVSSAMLFSARARGETLRGWKEARDELWRYMDENTILIGQSLNNDLTALRMVHTRVVDSAILTKTAVERHCARSWGLKTLADALLGLKIQTGKGGHDCLEDTLATREVVLTCTQSPEKLEAWAEVERALIQEEKERREQEKKEKEEREKQEKEEQEKDRLAREDEPE